MLLARAQPPLITRKSTSLAMIICVIFLSLFAVIAWSASRRQCATADEPMFLNAAFLASYSADFRLDKEDPPLFKYWAGWALGRDAMHINFDEGWPTTKGGVLTGGLWAHDKLYHDPNVDGESLIRRGQSAMLVIGIALGAVIFMWAWKLAGPLAACIASALFALEPTLLAHSALLKLDVPVSLVFLALTITLWLLTQRLTVIRILCLGLICGAALGAKFSGVLFLPMVALVMIARAMLSRPWPFAKISLSTRIARLAAVTAIGVTTLAISLTVLWAIYGFRFRPAPDAASSFDFPSIIAYSAAHEIRLQTGHDATVGEYRAWQPGLLIRAATLAHEHHLVPEAWLVGLLCQRAALMTWPGYLLGEVYRGGHWYYFPLALIFKEPITLLALLILAIASLRKLHIWRQWWFLIVPVLWYTGFAITSPVNVGIRHLLPIFPFLILSAAIAAASLAKRIGHRWSIPLGISALLILSCETLSAFPHFLPFFNAPAKLANPLYLLGDSNLDWGQDLPLLARWQHEHPQDNLYLCYFGGSDPDFFGINYHNLQGSFSAKPKEDLPTHPAIIAISATHLQGIYLKPSLRQMYQPLRELQPMEILGGSIYLYRWPGHPPK